MKLSFAKKTTLGLGAALLLVGQANAALITDWEWTLDAGWTATTPGIGPNIATDVTGTTPVTDYNGNPLGVATIAWGTDTAANNTQNDPSSITILNPNLDSGDALTDAFSLTETGMGSGIFADTVNGTKFVHHNNPIFAPFAVQMTLTDLFRLYPTGSDPAAAIVANPSFNWTFKETINDSSCWGVEGVDYASGNECPDIMVLANPAPLEFSFAIEEYIYTVNVTAGGVGPLPQAACDAVSPGLPGCFGLITQENADNPFQFLITLSARIPEPSILALMGIGLLGFGIRRRRQHK